MLMDAAPDVPNPAPNKTELELDPDEELAFQAAQAAVEERTEGMEPPTVSCQTDQSSSARSSNTKSNTEMTGS